MERESFAEWELDLVDDPNARIVIVGKGWRRSGEAREHETYEEGGDGMSVVMWEDWNELSGRGLHGREGRACWPSG